MQPVRLPHFTLEHFGRGINRRDLEVCFEPKVREQAALAHRDVLSQARDREPVKPLDGREFGGGIQDRLPAPRPIGPMAPTIGSGIRRTSWTLAMLHAAIHDALNAIEPRFQAYTPALHPARGASAEAAVAAAARDVLVTLLPEQAAVVEAEYDRALAAIPDGPAKIAGVAVGQASARAYIARRGDDGADKATQPLYAPRAGLGEYQSGRFSNLVYRRLPRDENEVQAPAGCATSIRARCAANTSRIGSARIGPVEHGADEQQPAAAMDRPTLLR